MGLVNTAFLPIGAVGGVGDDEGIEGVPLGHLVKAVDEMAVQLVALHLHVVAPIVLLIAQIGVDEAPVIHLPVAVVEGAGRVPRLAEEIGHGVGESILGIHRGGDAPGGRQQAAVGHKLGVEGAGGDVGRGVMVGKHQPLGLQLGQVGHVGLLEHPGVNGLQLDHYDVFPRQQAGVGVVLLGGLILGHIVVYLLPLPVGHGVLGEEQPPQVPDGVLIQTADHQGVGGVVELMVGHALVLLGGGLPDHPVHHREVMDVGEGHQSRPHQAGQHPGQHRPLDGLGGDDLQQPPGDHHQQHRDGRTGDDLPVDGDV